MNQWIGLAIFLVVWLILTQWLLPKLGVPS